MQQQIWLPSDWDNGSKPVLSIHFPFRRPLYGWRRPRRGRGFITAAVLPEVSTLLPAPSESLQAVHSVRLSDLYFLYLFFFFFEITVIHIVFRFFYTNVHLIFWSRGERGEERCYILKKIMKKNNKKGTIVNNTLKRDLLKLYCTF